MLADDVARVLRPGGPLAAELSGYERRPGQLAMAERVAHALDGDERLLVEAGTGTGKTIAYLVPAILSRRKVVVSTGTKTLQDQIASVDLPRLQKVLPVSFTFAVMKGLSNYLCLRRFAEHTRQTVIASSGLDEVERVRAWMETTTSGDRADMTELADDAPVWREITATPETRLGQRCPYFERCFVTGMRRRSLDAQIVLVNHHLFFADLALRSRWPEAQVLPPYEAVIFDEAHQIEDIATEFFGLHVSSQRMFALARDIGRAQVPPAAHAHALSLARRLQATTETLAESLRSRLPAPRGGSDEVRVPMPEDLWAAGSDPDAPLPSYHALDTVLEEAAAFFDRITEDDPAAVEGRGRPPPPELAAVYGGIARRTSGVRGELSALVDRARREQVRWLSASPRNVSLRSSPIDVAPILGDLFGKHPGPLVFTSATLAAANGFAYVRGRLGLDEGTAEAEFPSPFRYDKQALIYLAADLPDPNAADFPAAAAERVLDLCRVSRGRALALFTSFRNLRVAEARLRADGTFPLLVQGERPRHTLLEALRGRVGSVLLATQSFWEGVDVPGEALSLVVMDRLPFAVPDEPLIAARMERIREQDGDPFAEFQLPQAALALKQGFGRLIRTGRDTGVVALLDGRVLRRPYGATLLGGLPRTCPRTESLDDVRRFFAPPPSS